MKLKPMEETAISSDQHVIRNSKDVKHKSTGCCAQVHDERSAYLTSWDRLILEMRQMGRFIRLTGIFLYRDDRATIRHFWQKAPSAKENVTMTASILRGDHAIVRLRS
jgi:hypothetical protein